MRAIVVVDKNWGIGRNNDLLFQLPEDMKFFRKTTLNKVIVMGSNTLKSFPDGKPLKNRINVVLYPGREKRDDCMICDDMGELKEELKKYDPDDVFIVGGAMFYRTMLPYCSGAFVTRVNFDGKPQVYFENLDNAENWECEAASEPIFDNGYELRFCRYKNNNVINFFGGGND